MTHFEEIKIKNAHKHALERYPVELNGIIDKNSIGRHTYECGYLHGYENAILEADRLLRNANIDFDLIHAIYENNKED